MASDSIQVAIRVRPLIRREKDSSQKTHWKVNGNTVTQISNGKAAPSSCFTFDKVFDQIDTTSDVYEKFAKPVIVSAMLGFNATIFAYGQTSSGKTFTMLGDKESPGIIPHAIMDIFDHINEDPAREYLLVVTYMEIYNEVITDLLNPSNKNLKIHENSKREVFVSGITQCPVSGSDQIYRLMMEGEKNRHFGETNMNEKSSRSHTIFAIHIESRERAGPVVDQDSDDGAVLVSQLNLVDLAGSERVSLTGAEGQRLKEGAHINKSLFTLGSVIAKLSEGESFVPFRDSKLTRILQSSLGGNAKTGILCTITPASIEESVSTLKFASRAKTIKNCPSVNEVLDDGAMLKRMKKEIRDLKQQLSKLQENTCLSELQSEKEKFEKQLEETKAEHERQIQKLAASFLNSSRLTEKEGNGIKRSKFAKRRETWCPGALLSSNPLASAAEVAQSVLSNIDSETSSSSEESDTNQQSSDFMSLNNFEKILLKEEKKRTSAEKPRRVKFSDKPPSLFSRLPSVSEFVEKEIQTEDSDEIKNYKKEIEKLHIRLIHLKKENEDNLECIDQSNNNLERLMTEKSELEMKLYRATEELKITNNEKERFKNDDQIVKYKTEIEGLQVKILQLTKENNDNLEFIDQSNNNLESLINEKSELETKLNFAVEELKSAKTENASLQEKISLLVKNDQDGQLKTENKELRERVSELENECNLVNSCAEELQAEVNELRKENLALKSRLEENETLKENETEEKIMVLETKVKSYEQKLEDASKEISQLRLNLKEEVELKEQFLNESKNLKICESSLKEELENERNILIKEREDMEQLIHDLKESMVDVEGERTCLQEEFQCLLLEKDSEITSLMNELELVNQNFSDLEEKSREEIESLTKEFEERVSNRDATISELSEDVAKLKDCLAAAENEASKIADLELEKEALKAKFEELVQTKDQEIVELRRSLDTREEEADALRHELQKLSEEKEKGKNEGDSKEDQLKMQLEKLNEENKTLQESLLTITTERDEIKNELSDAITDSVGIQKDIFEAHQKVANYKSRMEELKQSHAETCNKVTLLEEELHTTKQELEVARVQNTQEKSDDGEQSASDDKYVKALEENEALAKINKELGVANEELQMKMKSFEDIEALKAQLEAKQQELQDVTNKLDSLQLSNKELQNSLEETKEKYVEMEQSCQAMEKTLKSKDACYDKLCREMNEYKLSVTSGQTQNKTFNIELEELKKEHAETMRELQNEQREHEALRTKYDRLKEQVEDTKVSLLRDSNRELTQQKEIDKMRSERRETICVQAQLRNELDKERDENEKKILELETRCRHLTAEKDLAEHKSEVCHQQLEDIKQQMKDMEQLYSQHSKSIVPSNGNSEKTAQRLKQVEFNLDITKQKFEKAEVRLKELEQENRQLKGADIRNNALIEERDVIKAQLATKSNQLNETHRKVNELSIEVTQLRSHIDKLNADTKKQKADLEKKIKKVEDLEIQLVQMQDATSSNQNFEEERQSLRQEIEGLQSRLKSKSMKCEELVYENKELLKKSSQKSASKCSRCSELETLKKQYQEEAQKLEKVQHQFDALKAQYEELSFKFDEQLMNANEKEIEAEEVARLKDEITRLNAKIANTSNTHGQTDKKNTSLTDEDKIQVEYQAEIINSLNMTIQTKDEELEHMTFLFDERELEINEARSSLQEYQNEMQQLKESIREKTEQADELQCEVEMLKIELEEAKQERCHAQKSIDELKNIIKEQETEMIKLGEKLQTMKLSQNEGQTNKDAQELMDIVESLRAELEEMKSSKDDIEQKNVDLQNKLRNAEDVEKGIDELQNKNEELRKKCEEMQNKNKELKSQLEIAQQKIEEQNCKLDNASASIERLRRVVSEQEDEIFNSNDDSQKKWEDAQNQNEELKSQLEAAQQKIEEQASKLEEASVNIDRLRRVVSEQEDEIFNSNGDFQKKLEHVQSQNEKLKSQLEAAQQKIKEQASKLEEASANIDRLRRVVSEQEDEIFNSNDDSQKKWEHVQSQNQELESQLEAAQQKIKEQASKLEEASTNIDRLRRVLSEQEEELFKENEDSEANVLLKEELELVKREVEEFKRSFEEEKELNTQLKMFLKEKENEVERLLEKVNDQNLIKLENNYHEIQESNESELLLSENEPEELRNSYESLKKNFEEATKKLTDFEIHILAKQAELEDLQEQIVRLQQENTKQKELMHRQRKQLTEMQDSLKAKQKECADLRDKIKSGVDVNQDKVETLKSEITEISTALSNERLLNEDLKEALESSRRHTAAIEDALQKTRQQKSELESLVHRDGSINEGKFSKSLADVEAENTALKNALKQLQDNLQPNGFELEEKVKELKCSHKDDMEKINTAEKENERLKNIIKEKQVELDRHIQKIQTLEEQAIKKTSQGVSWETYDKETNRLKKIIDEVQDELDDALLKLRTLESKESENGNEQIIIQLQGIIHQQKVELDQHIQKIQALEEQAKNKTSEGVSWETYDKETNRLKKIIDEVQDELDDSLLKIRTLESKEPENANKQNIIQLQGVIEQQKVELGQHIQKIQALEEQVKKRTSQGVSWETYDKETNRLKKIIDEVQDELDEAMLKINTLETKDKENQVIRTEFQKALNENELLKSNLMAVKESSENKDQEEQLESLRIELAGKNMKIQELEYRGYKKDEENNRLRQEVEYGHARLAKMKQEVRKLREESTQDSTVQLKKLGSDDNSDVGVVSSVAVFSLKAKVGQLENEIEKLRTEKNQLEKDKVTLSLLKTDAGNQVSRLTSEIYCLRKQVKELSRENRMLKGKDQQNVTQHVLAPSNTPDDSISHAQTQSEPANDKSSRTTRANSRQTENRPAQSNWLSPSMANEMFQDQPNQCQHQ